MRGKVVVMAPLAERTVHIVHANGAEEDVTVKCRTDDEALSHIFETKTFIGMPQSVTVVS